MDQQVGAHAVEGSTSTDAPAGAEGSSGLTRSLGHRTMLMIGLGSALGTGLFFGSGAAIGVAGPAAVVSYALGALLIAVIGLAMAEMATARPEPGSFGAAAGRYLGEWAGYVSRWCYWAASVIALGGEVVAAGAYLQYWWPHTSLTVFVALSALGNVITVTFAAARINQELAKEGIPLPFGNRFWASNWPTGKSPLPGLIIHLIPSIIVIIAPPPAVAYPFFLDVEGYPQQIINFAIVVGLFWLRWTKPHVPRPFKVWWPLAVFFLAAAVFRESLPFPCTRALS